jgi:hypothetical protein
MGRFPEVGTARIRQDGQYAISLELCQAIGGINPRGILHGTILQLRRYT